MVGPKDIELDIAQDMSDADFEDDSSNTIATDKWGNEWDRSGEFNDMDFRLVDDE
ncbi:MAG TPA: hypothetical protein VIH66_02445 [Gammaproteobacteria bacterium]